MAVRGEMSEKTRSRIREPKRYQVIMHNDDYTPMDFVVDILMSIFHKNEAEANILMMKVHREGEAAVGSYSYDVAISKQRMAVALAAEEGYPFRLSVREV
ncbi:MAG: ATP-dependent Clp protease adaptor ClpS [Lachnospiraceae bacterium]|nr:ATP-dependent Clp protease adaptor ClpS [Lachnospiraceae bacterium]